MKHDDAILIAKSIDEGYDMMAAATLLAGQSGVAPLFADDEQIEMAAQRAVALRARVRRYAEEPTR